MTLAMRISPILAVLLACGPSDGEHGSTGPTSQESSVLATAASDSVSSGSPAGSEAHGSASGDGGGTAPPIECDEGLTACFGYCTDLDHDNGNCGECGHVCEGLGASRECTLGQCEPGIWPCILPDQGIATCAEACASVGETCRVDADCSGSIGAWLTTSANDNNPQAMVDACMHLASNNYGFNHGCDDPIDWDFEILGRTVVGVACCCTQD
jgi:hypothetical protein